MAPIPPALIRLVVSLATQHLTRKLATSPAFIRGVSRILHEVDHLPHRIQGTKVPPWRDPNPTQQSIGDWAKGKFNDEDPGEPHDEPSPWASKSDSDSASSAASNMPPPPEPKYKVRPKTAADEKREKEIAEEDQRLEAVQAREREMRELLEKLRSGGK